MPPVNQITEEPHIFGTARTPRPARPFVNAFPGPPPPPRKRSSPPPPPILETHSPSWKIIHHVCQVHWASGLGLVLGLIVINGLRCIGKSLFRSSHSNPGDTGFQETDLPG
jgi:hypothetical protein